MDEYMCNLIAGSSDQCLAALYLRQIREEGLGCLRNPSPLLAAVCAERAERARRSQGVA